MLNDKKSPEQKDQQEDAIKKINLNDYAGDEEDNRIATEQANRYMDDIERAKEQQTLKPDEQQPE